MKFIVRFLLTAVSIPVFIILILSINIRFQFLMPGFWMNTLERANVYSKISSVISESLESKVSAEGGRKSDVAVLTSIISPLNVKDFTEKNFQSILYFANGKTSEVNVYIPVIESSENSATLEKISFMQFVKDYNIQGITQEDLNIISKFGLWSWLLLAASTFLIALIFFLMYQITPFGKHLGGMGTIVILPGIFMIGFYLLLNYFAKLLSGNYVSSSNIGTALGAVVAPPIIGEIIKIWLAGGILMIVLGILLFFVKKPAKNN